ncbi:MAG: amidinotransferase, partial [Chryseobacterium sp.]|nr:amidinotransferase [Chryseobacterium sp.]
MQTTNTVLMIEPINFGFNAETAKNNYFQTNTEAGNTQEKALQEFNAFVAKLRDKKINVITVKDSADSYTPDSIFPNNWVSFDAAGNAFLYPMFAENRRLERR